MTLFPQLLAIFKVWWQNNIFGMLQTNWTFERLVTLYKDYEGHRSYTNTHYERRQESGESDRVCVQVKNVVIMQRRQIFIYQICFKIKILLCFHLSFAKAKQYLLCHYLCHAWPMTQSTINATELTVKTDICRKNV